MKKYFFLLFIILLGNNLNAHKYDHNNLIINHPYTNQIRPGTKNSVFFIKNITNNSQKKEELIKVTTPYAETVEIHKTIKDNNIMKMRKIDKIEIPSNKSISLSKNNKNGYHIMLINIDEKLKNKEEFPATLFFTNRPPKKIMIEVHDKKNSSHEH